MLFEPYFELINVTNKLAFNPLKKTNVFNGLQLGKFIGIKQWFSALRDLWPPYKYSLS